MPSGVHVPRIGLQEARPKSGAVSAGADHEQLPEATATAYRPPNSLVRLAAFGTNPVG